MKIVISSGHGKYIRGASGYLDEVDEARKVVERAADFFRSVGVGVTTFHDDVSTTQNQNLNRIVNFHNSKVRDLDVSVHFNAYQTTSNPMGTECLYVTQINKARAVSSAVALAGRFTNRGPKQRTDLFFLNNTAMPAVLIETCFVDSRADADLYRGNFEAICRAIAESLSGQEITETPGEPPPVEPPPVERPTDPWAVPIESRPVLGRGDDGVDVEDLQKMLPHFTGVVDGDFGPITEEAVYGYQMSRGLSVDGIVGQQTWGALYARQPALPPPTQAFTPAQQQRIMEIANNSTIARYSWRDRGVAPKGYTQGMALAFAGSYKKLQTGHAAMEEMSKARTNSDKDALNIYRADFERLNMNNEQEGANVLRHLYALMLGHGMRESAGKHCEGRDQSASNVQSDTAEAGLFQTSYNAHNASDPEFDAVMNEFTASSAGCYLDQFAVNVTCSNSSWANYGSGRGRDFQALCKSCPAFAAETCGLTLRNLANHYGPIVRHETELKADADAMFKQVQDYVDSTKAIA